MAFVRNIRNQQYIFTTCSTFQRTTKKHCNLYVRIYTHIYISAHSTGHDKVQLLGNNVHYMEAKCKVVLAHSGIKRIIDLSCSKKNVAFPCWGALTADHSRSAHFFLTVLTQINAPQSLVLACEFNATTNHKPFENDLILVCKGSHTYISPWTRTLPCVRTWLSA